MQIAPHARQRTKSHGGMVEGRAIGVNFSAVAGCILLGDALCVTSISDRSSSGSRTLAACDPLREQGEGCGRTLISDRGGSWRTGRTSGAARGGRGRIAGLGPNADHGPGLPHGGRS
jgi:hypothetical protein